MATENVNMVQGAAKAATYNMVLQVSFRILTFVMNAVILRYISKELLGIVNVRLTLLYSTILFLSREAFRKACLSKIEKEKNWKQIINLIWCAVPVGVFVSIILCLTWTLLLEWPSEDYKSFYIRSVLIFSLSAILELSTEPVYIVGQQYLFVRSKVMIEGLALACKCGATVFLVVFFPEKNLDTFCAAQLVHSVVYVSLFYIYFACYVVFSPRNTVPRDFPFQSPRDFFPTFSTSSKPCAMYIQLVWSFLTQSILKQFLTEGERYVMTLFRVLTLGQQGIYDVINNLGSLVARFVFLPIEDSYYTLFSQILLRGKRACEQDAKAINISAKILSSVLKFVILLGVTIISFGYAYSYLLLDIYGGKILSGEEGPLLLRWYCVYVLVIAINGMTECFMFATMSQQEVSSYNKKMLLFSVAFLTSTLILTKLVGSVGFILANCLNMIFRIFHSVQFIKAFYEGTDHKPLMDAIPGWPVLLLYAISFVVTAASERLFCCSIGIQYVIVHVAVGACCLLAVGISILIVEKEFLFFLKNQWTGKLKAE